jgi:hypothetical protein
MQTKTRFLLAATMLGLAASAAQAQTAEDYSASVVVADQGAEARDQGLREALGIVASRVSGTPLSTRAAPVLARPATLVQQYSYGNNDKGELLLVASFDPHAVDAALKAQGLPVWGINAAASEDIALSISGVTTPRAYARALGYVRGLPGVKGVSVSALDGNVLHLRLRSEGGAARLAGAFSVGGVLKRQDSTDPRESSFALQN